MGFAEWALKSGEQITLVGLLLFLVIIGSIALYKKWIVLGWVHKDCETRLKTFEDAASAAADKANSRIEILERLIDEDRFAKTRKRATT